MKTQFRPAATATTINGTIVGDEYSDYVVNARAGQTMVVSPAANGPNMTWRLFNPDGTLLDEATSAREYRGQLWQSGDHNVEVTNRGNGAQSFNVIFGID